MNSHTGKAPKVGVLYSRVRVEEKLLFEAFERRGVSLDLLDDQKLIFDITDVEHHPYKDYDVIVERCINHSRALYSLKILNDQGIKTVNTALCADICGNKLMTTSALAAAGVAQPKALVAYTPESALEAIEQLGYGTNAKLHLQFATRLWNQAGPWGIGNGATYADTGYQCTWENTRAQSGATGILVDFTGGAVGASFSGDRTNPKVVNAYARTFLSQIEPVYPGLSAQWNGRATLDNPFYNPYLLGSYSYYRVGQYTLFGGAEGEASDQCHFAGEHCSGDFQGYMEGGAREGARAAEEILAASR